MMELEQKCKRKQRIITCTLIPTGQKCGNNTQSREIDYNLHFTSTGHMLQRPFLKRIFTTLIQICILSYFTTLPHKHMRQKVKHIFQPKVNIVRGKEPNQRKPKKPHQSSQPKSHIINMPGLNTQSLAAN
jgi:hypothetical protein